ncbi:MAG: nucleotide pyrophosphohydrolase [Thermoleophilia bacterium]|nr:nucleotide pyrophosphohydrolase [Thermoleophilia bacterium]
MQEWLERFRVVRDWRQFHTLKDLAAAIAVEAAELQEVFLWQGTGQEAELLAERRGDIEAEVADVLIQCLNFAAAAEIDVLAAMARKIEENEVKYPVEAARGTSAKYTELGVDGRVGA